MSAVLPHLPDTRLYRFHVGSIVLIKYGHWPWWPAQVHGFDMRDRILLSLIGHWCAHFILALDAATLLDDADVLPRIVLWDGRYVPALHSVSPDYQGKAAPVWQHAWHQARELWQQHVPWSAEHTIVAGDTLMLYSYAQETFHSFVVSEVFTVSRQQAAQVHAVACAWSPVTLEMRLIEPGEQIHKWQGSFGLVHEFHWIPSTWSMESMCEHWHKSIWSMHALQQRQARQRVQILQQTGAAGK
jgi:hypothetical protein